MKKKYNLGFLFFLLLSMVLVPSIKPSELQNKEQHSDTKYPIKLLNKDEVNSELDYLTLPLAIALEDPAFCLEINERLDKSTRKKTGFSLKELLQHQGQGSTILKNALKEVNVESKKYNIEPDDKYSFVITNEKFFQALNIGILNYDKWQSTTTVLYVMSFPIDVDDELQQNLIAVDSAGIKHEFDVINIPDVPLIVLQINDDIVRPSKIDTRKLNALRDSTSYPHYRAFPFVLSSGITDIHESSFNGPKGYAYFADAGYPKVGNLYPSLGGYSYWSTDVWASNFQGPHLVVKDRDQWEWKADGWLEACYRDYPFIYGKQVVNNPNDFGEISYKIMEHDDDSADDVVGYIKIDCTPCQTEVFQFGLNSGWTSGYTIAGEQDVDHVRYQLFCEHVHLPSAPSQTAPTPGSTVSTLTPTLSWEYESTYPEVTHYWVELRRADNSNLIFSDNTITVTQVQSPSLAYGTQYKWRVRAMNSEGWGYWSSYNTFWTPSTPTVPGYVSLSSPSNNSTVGSLRPRLYWYSVSADPSVDYYHLKVLKGGAVVQDYYVTGTSKRLATLLSDTKYRWRVRAHNSIGWGEWSDVWCFWTPN